LTAAANVTYLLLSGRGSFRFVTGSTVYHGHRPPAGDLRYLCLLWIKRLFCMTTTSPLFYFIWCLWPVLSSFCTSCILNRTTYCWMVRLIIHVVTANMVMN